MHDILIYISGNLVQCIVALCVLALFVYGFAIDHNPKNGGSSGTPPTSGGSSGTPPTSGGSV